jgi:Flp pilus assembly protein TadD
MVPQGAWVAFSDGTAAPWRNQKPLEPVSVQSLQHRVPKSARKAYDRGEKMAGKGDSRGATQEFEEAVALDPDYTDAHINLGVQYMDQQRFQEAEVEMRRAIALDSQISLAHSNLGWLLFQLRRLRESEESARRALALSPNNSRAHLHLGILLASVHASAAEGAWHIRKAQSSFPEVRRILEALDAAK